MAYNKSIILDDLGRIATVKAAGGVTGGFLVSWNSGTDVVGSGAETYAWGDVAVVECTDATGMNCLGMALNTAASGAEVSVVMQGLVILPAGSGGVSGGLPVVPVGYGGAMVEKIPTGSVEITRYPIGRALSKASDQGDFTIVRLNV